MAPFEEGVGVALVLSICSSETTMIVVLVSAVFDECFVVALDAMAASLDAWGFAGALAEWWMVLFFVVEL